MKRRSLLRTCAICHVEYPWTRAGLLSFSKAEGAYVCPGHWYEEPLKQDPTSSPPANSHPFSMAFGLLIISSLFLAVVIFATVDLGRAHHWNSLETTQVEDLPDSGTVKIVGVINESVISTVIGYQKTTTYGRVPQKIDPGGGFFNFSDETGTANVSWEHWYEIEKGPHVKLTNRGETAHVYEGGDTIMIIGIVEEENGEKRINLLYAAPQDREVPRSWAQYVFVLIFLPPHLLAYLMVIRAAIRQNRSHLSILRGLPQFHPETPSTTFPLSASTTGIDGSALDTVSPPLKIRWYRNSHAIPFSLFSLFSIILFMIPIGGFLWLLLRSHMRAQYWGITVMYPLASIFFLMCFFAIFKWSYTKPRRVGISEKGIHFLYADPYVQFSNPGFSSWEDIKYIGTIMIGMESSYHAIKLEKHHDINLSDVKKKIRKALISEWERRNTGVKERERRYALMKPE